MNDECCQIDSPPSAARNDEVIHNSSF